MVSFTSTIRHQATCSARFELFLQRIDRLQPTACAVCQDKTGKEAKQSSRSDKAARERDSRIYRPW